MSRYEELSALFGPWRSEWFKLSMEHKFVPTRVAKAFENYLGCPEMYQVGFAQDGQKESYVRPATAIRGDDDRFTLTVFPDGVAVKELAFENGGDFHFGLRVMLESSPNTHPKEPFWFTFKARYNEGKFVITTLFSGKTFEVDHAEPASYEPLSEHLFEMIKAALSESPIAMGSDNSEKIGFAVPPSVK